MLMIVTLDYVQGVIFDDLPIAFLIELKWGDIACSLDYIAYDLCLAWLDEDRYKSGVEADRNRGRAEI